MIPRGFQGKCESASDLWSLLPPVANLKELEGIRPEINGNEISPTKYEHIVQIQGGTSRILLTSKTSSTWSLLSSISKNVMANQSFLTISQRSM